MPRISSPVLVGRDADLTALLRATQAAGTGQPRFVIVRGEAGIGKSRLVLEASARAREHGVLVLVGECLDIGAGGLPYLPLAEALRGLARQLTPDVLEQVLGPGRRELAAIVPELSPEVADPVAGPWVTQLLQSGLGQARLFERVLGVLGALTAVGPTALIIEDVHWIDDATRDLLTFLSHNLTSERLALVLTCRVDDLPRGHPILAWLAAIERSAGTVTIELGRLDRSAVEDQLRVLSDGAAPPELVGRIWRRSEGNPLFVEELMAAAGNDETEPGSLVEMLLARVVKLEPEERAVVDAAAVAGRPVDDRLLADVLGISAFEVDDRLRAALDAGVLQLDSGTERYRVRHELLREVIERELLPGHRRRLHERFARRLQARPELADTSPVGAAAELAHHYAAADLPREAYTRSIDAAAAAEAVHAYADAHRHLERALDLEARLPTETLDTVQRLSLRRRAADDADLGNDVPRAMELTLEALSLVDPAADPVTAGLLHSRIGYLQWSLGDGTGAIDAHELAVRLVPGDPPSPERARVLASLGGGLMGAGRWAESRAVCEAAIECAVATGARAEESRARNMLGSDLVALGAIDEGIAQLREACAIAGETGPADMLIVGHFNLALNLAAADRLEEALASAEAGRAAAHEAGLQRRFGQDLAALAGDILIRLGRTSQAEAVLEQGLALAPGEGSSIYLRATKARLLTIRGDLAGAEEALASIDLDGLDPDVAAYVAGVAVDALTWDGRPEEALAMTERGLRHLEGLDDVLWTAPLVALGLRAAAEWAESARARRADGDRRQVLEMVEPLRARLDWLDRRVTTTSGRGWVALAQGELARIAGDDGPMPWRAAIEAFDAVPDPLAGAYARFRVAEASLRAAGVRADVAGLVQAAATVTADAGARLLHQAIATLAVRARLPVNPQAPANQAVNVPDEGADGARADPRAAAVALGLSPREIEVLELVASGLSNGEIAERLFITRKTAGVHVTHILDKLGVANRVGAAMVAARVGLSAPSDGGYSASE
jgi:DNA-binding CsgD family transcriptional regulator/tetratricopeptide (TPR) repeat protein